MATATTLRRDLSYQGILNGIIRKVSRLTGQTASIESASVPTMDEADSETTMLVVSTSDGVVANYGLTINPHGGPWKLTKTDELLSIKDTRDEIARYCCC